MKLFAQVACNTILHLIHYVFSWFFQVPTYYTSHIIIFDYEMENCRYLASPGVLDARFGCTPYKVEVEASGVLTCQPTTGFSATGRPAPWRLWLVDFVPLRRRLETW